jgi:putative nucleotidyltransferase with HDIG domain
LFTLLLTAGVGFALTSELLLTRRVRIQAGQAASEDIAAPRRIEFESEIGTKAEIGRVLADVKPVYDPLDRQVGREQVNRAQQILSFIDAVRADPYASVEEQRRYLEGIDDVSLSSQAISYTLQLDDSEWKAVWQDTRQVLAAVMSDEIKDGDEGIRRRGVRARISFDLSEPQTVIVEEIVSALVKANRAYNAEATEAAKQAALAGIEPRIRVLEENEIILRNGEIVGLEDIEALDALGLRNPQVDWRKVSGSFLFVFLLAVSMSIYLWFNNPALLRRWHHLLLILLLLVLFTLLARWGVSPPISQLYLAPLATLGMLVAVLFDVRLALVVHLAMCLIVGYMTGGQADLFLYEFAGGLIGIFALRRVNRINTFVGAGMYVILVNVAVITLFALLSGALDTLQLGRAILIGIINGALAAITTLGGYYLLGILFNIATALQLMDLARPTHPLMRELLLKAPGTYHHSIMVGNMAEQAAETIGADALLTRVGAFYHDIGKTLRPYFFSENQMEDTNPHDLLDPETSAHIIRSHTKDGLGLARKYRLPRVLQDFIAQHHGTAKIGYFYHKAVQEYGEEHVEKEKYQHYGPRPQTKETAIVMLADVCEAAVHSVRPHDPEALEKLIRRLIATRISSGQLNDSPLTLQEIEIVAASFIRMLQGAFHTRIRYPGGEQGTALLRDGIRPILTAPGESEDGGDVRDGALAALEPGLAPLDPESVPLEPQAVPLEPQAAPLEPQAAPLEPQAVPLEPQAVPLEPQTSPLELQVESTIVEPGGEDDG